jgi:sulfur-oxidizing protein SoxY
MGRAPNPSPAALATAALVALLAAAPLCLGDSQSPTGGAWLSLRPQLYGSRNITEGDEQLMSIEAPASTPDPAATPVVVHFGKALEGKVKQVRVIIDNNPSPLVATMDLKPGLLVDEIDLRVRIDRFSSVRAIAETGDGKLQMASTWVNAAGGCSTPSSATEGGMLGQIRFRPSSDDRALQISIRHPNNSGFQVDPRSGDFIPPHFIAHIRLSAGGQTLMEADTGISLSENPTLRIATDGALSAPMTVDATDAPTEAHFTATWQGTSAGMPN